MISNHSYQKKKKKNELQSALKTTGAQDLHFTSDLENQMLFRLSEIEVHCLAVPCASSVQHELGFHSAPFLIIFLCVCVCGV